MLLQATCRLAAVYAAPLSSMLLPTAAAACAGSLRLLKTTASSARQAALQQPAWQVLQHKRIPGMLLAALAPHAWRHGACAQQSAFATTGGSTWSTTAPLEPPAGGFMLRDEVLEARAAAVRRARAAAVAAGRGEAWLAHPPAAADAAYADDKQARAAPGLAPAPAAVPATAAAAVLPLRVKGIGRKMLLRQVRGLLGCYSCKHSPSNGLGPACPATVFQDQRVCLAFLPAPAHAQLNRSIIRRVARRATIGVPM
jgi:hypothetical protein